MLIYLMLAYVIFCLGPLGLAVSIVARRRHVRRLIRDRVEVPQKVGTL
ncbi:MAG: hypothetical protein JXA21_09640 [Anaerolineae bacterium]|nr:hypothetical protein [Anaerolineae bacterium]